MQAVRQMYKANKSQVLELFAASALAHEPLGDFTFMYGAGLLQIGRVQAGHKRDVCRFVEKMTDNYTTEPQSDLEYSKAVGSAFAPQIWNVSLNFTRLRDAVHEPLNKLAGWQMRPWWWMKCTQLGWFKTGPRSGLSTIPFEELTVDKFLDACRYMFPNASLVSDATIADFNSRFGGEDQHNVTNVFTVDYSDDPWKMATTTGLVERQRWPLGETQPFMLLTCDGCSHCGEGAPTDKLLGIVKQELFFFDALARPQQGRFACGSPCLNRRAMCSRKA